MARVDDRRREVARVTQAGGTPEEAGDSYQTARVKNRSAENGARGDERTRTDGPQKEISSVARTDGGSLDERRADSLNGLGQDLGVAA